MRGGSQPTVEIVETTAAKVRKLQQLPGTTQSTCTPQKASWAVGLRDNLGKYSGGGVDSLPKAFMIPDLQGGKATGVKMG